MTIFSKVVGYLVDKYRGSTNSLAIHQVEAGAKPETSMSCFAPGIEINPADGENLVITKIKNSSSFVVSIGGTNQNIAPDTGRGERKIYSVSADGKTLMASMKFLNDGTIEMLTSDPAKKFTMTFGTTIIEFSVAGMKITAGGVTYNALTHLHPTGVGPSGPPTPNT